MKKTISILMTLTLLILIGCKKEFLEKKEVENNLKTSSTTSVSINTIIDNDLEAFGTLHPETGDFTATASYTGETPPYLPNIIIFCWKTVVHSAPTGDAVNLSSLINGNYSRVLKISSGNNSEMLFENNNISLNDDFSNTTISGSLSNEIINKLASENSLEIKENTKLLMENIEGGVRISGDCIYVIGDEEFPVYVEADYFFEGTPLPKNQYYNIKKSVTTNNLKNKTMKLDAEISITEN